jgi:electron transfer flavoprotein beta subunit
MKVLVTVKRVTDPNVKIKLLPDGSGVDTANVEFKMNPYDEYSLEEALRLRERHPSVGEIVVVSVGDEASTKELRVAMAMGADRGILVKCDDGQLDPSAVAELLAAVIEREKPDLVMMGKLSVDGENMQVPQMVAQKLGWGQGAFALELDLVDGGKVAVGAQADGGQTDLRVSLPCVITRSDMPDEAVRFASLPGIMKAKKKPLDMLSPAELGVTPQPRMRILGYEVPPKRSAGEILESVDALVAKLKTEVKVL